MLKLINLFGFKNKTAVLTSAIVIFFPRCIQFSAMVNNDALSLMFSILALYFALKWQKQGKNPINILLCAFACGFGMMTKLATATICLPIAGVFVYEFILEIKQFILDKKNGEKVNFLQRFSIILQYVGFLLVCAPLALWFQFYVSARFGQNFGFVFDNLNHRLSTEHHSLFERLFFTFDLNEYFGQIYCSPFYTDNKLGVITNYNHYNLFNYQLRSALFGEFWYDGGEGFAVFALIASFAFCAVLAVAVVKCCLIYFKGRKNGKKALVNINFKDLIFIVLLFISQVIPEIIFYIRMPYACTMDFRYVMPIIVGLAVTVGYVSNILKSEGSQFSIGLNNVLTYTIIVVLLAMTLFYCVCM
jgi:4-amino-4-deoxy-L-arabinose transferase-like glycosyltransferase